MSARYSEDEVIAAVSRLTRPLLVAFVDAEVVVPEQSQAGPVYCQIDLARLDLLCDLVDQFDLRGDALGVVISLIDQLHTTRHQLHIMAEALEAEPLEVRQRVGTYLVKHRSG